MVDGINILNSRLPGTGEIKEVVSKSSAVESRRQKTQALEDAPRLSDEVTKSVSSEIAESADKRLESLSLGKTGDYLQAAEKIISASLPNQPPGTRLRINLDDGSGRFVYQGVDVDTGDVVTQFPSEEILKFVAFNREREGLEGIVVDEEA